MNSLQSYATSSMANPSSQLSPIYGAGLNQINQQFAAAPQAVTEQLASRGYGSSGLEGNSLVQVANAKAGAQSNLSGQIAQDAVQQGQFGASLANALLNTGKGTSTTGSTSSNGTSSSQGNSTTTSDPSVFSDILGSLGTLLGLGGALGGNFGSVFGGGNFFGGNGVNSNGTPTSYNNNPYGLGSGG